jgi:hypothetical protein
MFSTLTVGIVIATGGALPSAQNAQATADRHSALVAHAAKHLMTKQIELRDGIA